MNKLTNRSNSTQDTEDVVALVEAVRAESRAWVNAGQGKRALRLSNAADRLQSLSDRIDVLEGENERLRAAVSWIEPPFVTRNTDVAELRKRVQFCVTDAARAALHQEGIAP